MSRTENTSSNSPIGLNYTLIILSLNDVFSQTNNYQNPPWGAAVTQTAHPDPPLSGMNHWTPATSAIRYQIPCPLPSLSFQPLWSNCRGWTLTTCKQVIRLKDYTTYIFVLFRQNYIYTTVSIYPGACVCVVGVVWGCGVAAGVPAGDDIKSTAY